MSLSIKALEAPEIIVTKMNVDTSISKKLEQYPMVNTCFNRSNFSIFAGSMGRGKTSTVVSLLRNVFRKCFHTIYIIIPEGSRMSIENDFLGKNIPADQLFGEISPEILEGIYERMKDEAKEGYKSLLIIDDFGAMLKDKNLIRSLAKIITKIRHLKTSVWLLQQSLKQLPKILRELVSNVVFFDLGKSQLQFLFDELIPLSKENFEKVTDYLFGGEDDNHSYGVINTRTRKLYKGIDQELVVPKL